MSPFLQYVEGKLAKADGGLTEFVVQYIGPINGYEYAKNHFMCGTGLIQIPVNDALNNTVQSVSLDFEARSVKVETPSHQDQYTLGIKTRVISRIVDPKFKVQHEDTLVSFLDHNVLICFEDNQKRCHIKLINNNISKAQIKSTAKRMQYAVDSVIKQLIKPWTIQDRWSALRTMSPPGTSKLKFDMPQALLRDERPLDLNSQYQYSVKLNGSRTWICIMERGTVFLVDRNFQVTQLYLDTCFRATLESFDDIIFDAEQYNGVFYIFDSIVTTTNYDMYHYTLDERKSIVKQFCTETQVPAFQMKEFYSDFNFVSIQLQLEPDKNRYDGIIFTPIGVRIYAKDSPRVLKWKQRPTLDLLYLWNNEQALGDMYVETESSQLASIQETLRALSNIEDRPPWPPMQLVYQDPVLHGQIVEVEWDTFNARFQILQIRQDKKKPNYITVALECWDQIVKPVTLQDLSEWTN